MTAYVAYSKIKSALLFSASVTALALLASPALAQQVAQSDTESVIVTGTRVTGMTAADSAAPITVIGSDALARVGQPNLIQALAQIAPSFTAEALGGDTGALTLSARLRGLSPNDTLVLINGKRRHSTGNLHVLSGQYQGAATADLDMIPVAAIDHVEVLQEGAAAQYGTDAIAGVVNIILKRGSSGGMVSATGGQYFQQGGDTYDFNGNFGIDLGGKGFLNISGEKRYRGFSQRGAQDIRLVNAAGVTRPTPYNQAMVNDYPNANHIVGDPESMLTTVVANFEYDLEPNITLYANASYGERDAKAYENVRLPTRITAAAGSNLPFNAVTNPDGYVGLTAARTPNLSGSGGGFNSAGELIPFPNGFNPQEALKEEDYGYSVGLKGDFDGWKWDLSGTYGKDRDKIYTLQSANGSLFLDTHTTPRDFYDGMFTATEATFNLDITKNLDVGLASPLTLAFGGEGRENTFGITQGDFASTYKEGGSSYPGFVASDSGSHSRKNYAAYFDLAVSPITDLQVDLAGRFEHYTDFGDAQVGKITARYDITPEWAVRGTISTGFRAPTIQEEFYSATNVGPTTAFVQLPPNSPAAAILGVKPLQPEASTSYSAGIVAHPFDNFSLTVDAYSISLRNRIVGTGSLYGSGGTPISPTVPLAIAAHGNILDPTVTFTGVTLLLNGISTLTQGVDVSANYLTDFGDFGSVNWTLAGNYNDTSISKIIPTPAALGPGVSLFDQSARSYLTRANPKEKIGLSALWTLDPWSINLRETFYGPTSVDLTPDGATYYNNKVSSTAITDIEIDYNFLQSWTVAFGANNLTDERPEGIGVVPGDPTTLQDGSNIVAAPLGISPYGINGGFYYTRLTFKF
ncbi:MAG: TonB-dependent receptor [Alphaproteobacteria bacterium]|nr:TonB-dependent receptor [Alphaproteobacteria bacterium]